VYVTKYVSCTAIGTNVNGVPFVQRKKRCMTEYDSHEKLRVHVWAFVSRE
jgi:hypothetical protein